MPPVGLRYKDVSSVQQRIFVPFDPSKGNNNAQIAVFIIDRVFDATNTLELCTRQISQNPYPIRILPS